MSLCLISCAFALTSTVRRTFCHMTLNYSSWGVLGALQLPIKNSIEGSVMCFFFVCPLCFLSFCTIFNLLLCPCTHDQSAFVWSAKSVSRFDIIEDESRENIKYTSKKSLYADTLLKVLPYWGIRTSLFLFTLFNKYKDSPHVCSHNCYHPSSSTRVDSLSTAFCPNMLSAAVCVFVVQ